MGKKTKNDKSEELNQEELNATATDASAENQQREPETIEVEIPDSEKVVDMKVEVKGEETIESELEKTRQALRESQDQLLRMQAEFQNFRKRKEKELGDSIRYANGDLLVKLLPILDNFDRTLEMIDKTDNLSAIKEGIALVDKSMKNQLEKIGLRPIKSIGKEFDVDLHEAITAVQVEEEAKKGKVIDEVSKGYKLEDKVLRFSKVIVGE